MKASFALFLLVLLFPIQSFGAEKSLLTSAPGLKVSLPEGLYLYQPWVTDVIFAPLFMVRDHKLLNPYELYGAKERGQGYERTEEEEKALDRFMSENVIGKTFNIYVGTEKLALLSDVVFKNRNECEASGMPSDLRGAGDYECNIVEKFNALIQARFPVLPFKSAELGGLQWSCPFRYFMSFLEIFSTKKAQSRHREHVFGRKRTSGLQDGRCVRQSGLYQGLRLKEARRVNRFTPTRVGTM